MGDFCCDCGMTVSNGEYHPYAACLMFKACHDSETVRANLTAVMAYGAQDEWNAALLAAAKVCRQQSAEFGWNGHIPEVCAQAIERLKG
jgi:hypothetical protein